MSIEFRCSGCGRRYRVADTAAGKRMRCKACGAINLIEQSRDADAFESDPYNEPDAFAEPATSYTTTTSTYVAPAKPRVSAPAYVAIPGEDAIDRFLPLAIISLFAIELLWMLWRDVSIVHAGMAMFKANVNDNMTSFGPAVCRPLLLAVVAAVITAPLLMLSVVGVGRLLPFSPPKRLYVKSLAASCAAWGTALALTGLDLQQINTAVPITAGICVMLGIFWLLLRLRLERFGITAVGAALCCALSPILFTTATKPMNLARRGFDIVHKDAHGFSSRSVDPHEVIEAEDGTSDDQVRTRLQKIWKAVSDYADSHGGRCPAGWNDLGGSEIQRLKYGPPSQNITFAGLRMCKTPLPARVIVAEGPLQTRGDDQYRLELWGDGTISEASGQLPKETLDEIIHAEMGARKWLLQDSSEPLGALAMFLSAISRGDADGTKAHSCGIDDAVAAARAEGMAAAHDFLQAAVNRFPAPQGGEPQPPVDEDDVMGAVVALSIKGLESRNGDQATVTFERNPFNFRKFGSEWKVDLSANWGKYTDQQNKIEVMLLRLSAQATHDVTQKISSGSIPDWDHAKGAYTARLQELEASDKELADATDGSAPMPPAPPSPWAFQHGLKTGAQQGVSIPGLMAPPLPPPIRPHFNPILPPHQLPPSPTFNHPQSSHQQPKQDLPPADWNPRDPIPAQIPNWSEAGLHAPDRGATEEVGGKGGSPFLNPGIPGRQVVGFRYIIGDWKNQPVLQRLDPIIPLQPGEQPVQWPRNSRPIVARLGYAVGGLLVDYDDTNVIAVKVIFMRQTNGQLDPKQQYTSDWIGKPSNGNQKQLGGTGVPVMSTFGRQGLNLAAIGLIFQTHTHLSPMLGSSSGGEPYIETGDGEKPVVGFRYTLGHWDVPVVGHLRPLYDPAGNDPLPEHLHMENASKLLARDGYVVTGLQVESDDTNVIAIRVVFAKFKDGAVDPKDTYTSDWIGKLVGRNQTEIGGHGAVVTGVFGRQGLNLASIGLILKGEK